MNTRFFGHDQRFNRTLVIEHSPEDDYAILANEGCLLTETEFDKREKAGTLPEFFL